ncbi:hypothetical protein OC845_003424 [Tilletia horrida]|nr:hypothetical protein OC845_003424 [Tilletia horrida]
MVVASGAAKLALTLGLSVGTAAALAYSAYSAYHQPNSFLYSHWSQSTWPAPPTPPGAKPGPTTYLTLIDSTLELILPVFKLIRIDLLSTGLFSLALSGILPLATHFTYLAISPNPRLSFLTASLAYLTALVHFLGGGIFTSGPLTLLYTLGALLFFFSNRSQLTPLPTAAAGAHLVNLIVALHLLSALGFMLLDVEGSNWYKCFLGLVILPIALVYLPTLATTGSRTAPQSQVDVRRELALYSPGELASAFERTWSSYRRIGLASAILYWYGIGRLGNHFLLVASQYNYEIPAVLHSGAFKLNDAAFHSLLTFLGNSVALLAIITVERLTLRAKASELKADQITENLPKGTKAIVSRVTEQHPIPHPLTGQERSKVDLECEKAVARAPAGHPILELGVRGTVLALLLGGPGLAAGFWWARGEEESGWKARREWREVQALASKKQ